MAKKHVDNVSILFENPDEYMGVTPENIENHIQTSMLAYGDHINRARAIPSVFDGLKPVQRRALYTFKYLNATNKFVKLAYISGACMGNFHPHGDSSINDTVVNLVQVWKNNLKLLVGQGSWGSLAGDSAAAARYVEVKLPNDISNLLFENIDKDGVIPWQSTYDETKLEPSFLPVKYPLHLLNGTSGIGYSMGTNILSYNAKELTDLFIYLIENKFYTQDFDVTEHASNMKSIVKGVDLPTGSNIYQKDGDYLFDSSFGIGCRATFTVDPKHNTITITNIPPDITTEKIKEEILDLALDYKIQGVGKKEVKISKPESEILQLKPSAVPLFAYEMDGDEPLLDTPYIVLTFRNGADLNVEVMKLISKTCLDTSCRSNLIVVNGKGIPESISLYQNVRTFLRFRLHCLYQSILFDIKKLNEQIHVLEGLKVVLSDKKNFFDILYNSKDLKVELSAAYPNLTEIQVDYILKSAINKLSQNEITDLYDDIVAKLKVVSDKEDLIRNEDVLYDIIKNEYVELAKSKLISSCERKSQIIDCNKVVLSDLIEDEEVIVLSMSDETIGYIQASKHKAHNKGAKLHSAKSEFDIDGTVNFAYFGMLKDDCLFITNKGRVFKESLWKLNKRFLNIRNYLNLDKDEFIISINKYNPEDNENTHLILITSLMAKNIRLDSFDAASPNRGVIALKLNEDDYVTSVLVHNPNIAEDLIILSKDGKVLRINKSDLPEIKGRTAIGTRIINKKFSVLKTFLVSPEIIDLNSLDSDDGKRLILVSDNGQGKIVALDDIRTKKIKQSPLSLFNNNDKNGKLLDGFYFDQEDDLELTLVSNDSDVSVIKLKDLNAVSRTAKGSVKLISNTDESKITNCFLKVCITE